MTFEEWWNQHTELNEVDEEVVQLLHKYASKAWNASKQNTLVNLTKNTEELQADGYLRPDGGLDIGESQQEYFGV